MPSHSGSDDLQAYFTDVEHLRETFKTLVAAPELPRRILVIHGVGGVGKSSLLRILRLHCKSVNVPIALASGDEAKSALAILGDWADDLKTDGVTLSTFAHTLLHYRAIQAKAEDKAQESRKKMGELASKAAGKVAETAAGAAIGAAVGSAIPGIGTLAGALGGMGAEALVDWLRGQGFAKAEIGLLLDPAKKLTDDFLSDMGQVAPKRRVVLMLDTFEQLTALDDWARDLAQRLHPNVLLVLAGRAMPRWSAWSGWLAQAHVEELRPMTEDVMRTLVRRYYAMMRGGEPDPKQVEAIIRFARGLPMVVTTAVRLWVEYGVEDFETVKAEVVADLVDRLKEGVPAEMTPVLEAAAAVRWFNKEILRAVTGKADVNKAYDELRRFPFVRPRVEGLMLHDAVREIMDDYLRVHDPEHHRELHERAAGYFEAQMAKRTGEEAERLGLERLYHRVRADEEVGIKLFEEMAEKFTQYRLVNRLRALLIDVNTYLLEHENSQLWLKYYSARLAYLEARLAAAEKVYQAIGEDEHAEPKLRAYALCDWGWMLRRREVVRGPGGLEVAVRVLQSSLSMGIPVDSKMVLSWVYLSDVYTSKPDWDNAVSCLEQARKFFINHTDYSAYLIVLDHERGIFARQGNWRRVFETQVEMQKTCIAAGNLPHLKTRSSVPWEWLWMGRYREWEEDFHAGLEISKQREELEWLTTKTRDFGLCIALQGKCSQVLPVIEDSLALARSWGNQGELQIFETSNIVGIIWLRCGDFEKAIEYLTEAIEIGKRLRAHLHVAPLFLAIAYEVTQRICEAEEYYRFSYDDSKAIDRNYVRCAALTGLVRVKHTQGDYAAIPPLLAEAEQLAQQYEYNDHLASLRLRQGHIAWEGVGQVGNLSYGYDAALHYYQHALIYALRYNRFLLDEVLSGRPQGTPLHPVTPYCLERGEEGQRMLLALRDCWKTGMNNIGTPHPDTISPISEGIPLLEAERIAREREPGDGSPQTNVAEQIEMTLSEQNAAS